MKVALIFWVLISSLVFVVNAQEDGKYRFPNIAGTESWKQISSYEDRLDLYNIHEDTLMNMNTKRLALACLDYPELRLVMTRNDLQTGYAYVYSVFNGFRNLESREDSGNELIKIYEQIDVKEITRFSLLQEQGDFSFSLTYVETLLSQSGIIEKLSQEEKRKLVSIALVKHEEKTKLFELYASFGLSTTSWIIAKVLQSDSAPGMAELKKQYSSIDFLLRYGLISDESAINSLLRVAKTYK